MKKRIFIILLIILILGGFAWGFLNSRKDPSSFTVGICQFMQHDALDEATQGFKDALTEKLGDRVIFDEKNAQGDYSVCTAAMNDLVSKDVDLILANSTAALQTAATSTTEIPILGTSVTNYAAALQIDGFDGTVGGNISGTTDLAPLEEQAAMIRELFPEAKKAGLLYCSSEPNSQYQAEVIRSELEALGFTCEAYPFSDSNAISSVTITASSACDVLYIPTDNAAAANAELIANICVADKTPVITGEESTCRICGAATLSIDYYSLGYATGEMAVRILEDGEDIAAMPIEFPARFTKKYNETICKKLGIEVPKDYVALP